MKYIRSIIAGLAAVLVTFVVVAMLLTRNRQGFVFLAMLVYSLRAMWLVVAGVFLGGFVVRLWVEDRHQSRQ